MTKTTTATFKRITGKQWAGNGMGSTAAEHELLVNGKSVGITIHGFRSGGYVIRKDGVAVKFPATFAIAKQQAITAAGGI